MPKHLDDCGSPVAADDPNRLVWYTYCGYWTDDFDTLARVALRIPTCPACGVPGMQTEYHNWQNSVDDFDDRQPGFASFLAAHKGRCFRDAGGLHAAWAAHRAARPRPQEPD